MANNSYLLNKDDNLKLEISEDKTSAYLTIKDTTEVIDANDIVDLLKRAGIVTGFEEAARINRDNQNLKKHNNQILIAQGSNATVEPVTYFINIESKFNPARLNWFTIKNTTIISADEQLAKINLNTTGAETDIYGNKLPNEAGKINPHDLLGENVYYNEEDFTIYSQIKGYAFLDENKKLQVTDSFKVCESLQNSSIYTYGDVTIEGDIVDSYVEHDGNLKVLGNIVNCRNGGIEIEGELSLETGDNSNIYASKSITFHKDIRYCRCITDGFISGAENGAFVGGSAAAGNYIDIEKIGSPFHIATSLEIGITPFQKFKISKRQKKLEKITPDSLDFTLHSTQLALEENNFLRQLEKSLTKELKPFIKASKIIYQKTSIRILDQATTLSKDLSGHRFAKNDPKLS